MYKNPSYKNGQSKQQIGYLLVRENYISEADLKKALAVQQKEINDSQMPIEALLVKRRYLTKAQISILKSHPDLRKRLGTMVAESQIASADEIKEILSTKDNKTLTGQSLIKNELISRDALEELIEIQKDALEIGELAVRLKMLKEIDLVRLISSKNSPRSIGQILYELDLIRPDELSAALKKYKKREKIGEILIRHGMISQTDFNKVMKDHSTSTEKIGSFLINKNLITEHQLYHALSNQYNIPYMDLDEFSLDPLKKNVLTRFASEKYARRNMILPLSIEDEKLLIGISYPDALSSIDELKNIYRNLIMSVAFITEKKFTILFSSLYNQDYKVDDQLKNNLNPTSEDLTNFDFEKLPNVSKKEIKTYYGTETEIKNVVSFIIHYGIISGASDIHLEQDRKGTKLRYRIDGVCQEPEIPWLLDKVNEKPEAIISRIKVMSELDISERRMPQDGVFRASYKDGNKIVDLDFRVATCPAIVGETITIRILDSRKASLGLENLNHSPENLKKLQTMLKNPTGMVLVTGPTGSGKSSTLYAALQYIHEPGIKIITAEDPIEYSFPGIVQTQVNSKIGLTFARLLRSFLRLDPDTILVGEIRDQETAAISFDATQTGHQLLSTLHTNDSVSAVTRLLDLGIDHNQIASGLTCVLSQRLTRKNCTKCVRRYNPPKEEWQLFFYDYPKDIKFYKGLGCKSCNFTGFSGRTLVSELFELNHRMSVAISSKSNEKELKMLALKQGMRTMVDDGISKLDQIALSELIRVLPLEMIQEFKLRYQRRKSSTVKVKNSG